MTTSIYIVPSHAEMIYSGKKKAIVKKRHLKNYLSNSLTLVTKKNGVGYALGKIKLAKPKLIDISEFKKLQAKHLVSDSERKAWWPGAKKLYYYDIIKFDRLKTPKIVYIKPGVQTIQYMAEDVDFIKDINSYNPATLSKKVLVDDWKIVCAWYSSKKQGKKIKFTNEQILKLASQIHSELLRRGIHPGQTKISKELIKEIKKDFSKYLPIYRGTESEEGPQINLSDFTNKWKSFIIHKDFAYLVGSLPNWQKTVGDIDILIKAEPNTTLWNLFTWRVMRAYPELSDRFHFIPYDLGNWRGPFTNFVSLGDLEVSVSDLNLVEMSALNDVTDFSDFSRDPNFKKHCEQSEKEDKLVLFRPFFQEKPQHGRNVGEAYNLDSLVEVVKKTW